MRPLVAVEELSTKTSPKLFSVCEIVVAPASPLNASGAPAELNL